MRHATHRRTRPPVTVLLLVLLLASVTGLAALVASGLASPAEPRYVNAPIMPDRADQPDPLVEAEDGDGTSARSTDDATDEGAAPQGVAMLRSWDAARARAWAAGDVRALSALYTDGSAAGRRDAAALQAYVDRGLRVEGLRSQVLAVEAGRTTPGTRVLRVTDRLAGGVARDAVSGATTALPTGQAERRELTWRLVDDRWLLARVSAVPA